MRSLLGVLMVLAVSDNEVNIPGFAGKSVLLPCNCTGRNKSKGFHWQLDAGEDGVFIINQDHKTGDGYQSRAELSVNDTENCSLSLINLNTTDTGKYKCIFTKRGIYQQDVINLNVTDFRNLNVSVSSDRSSQDPPKGRIRFLKIIPIVLLLGFCLVLWFRRERVSH